MCGFSVVQERSYSLWFISNSLGSKKKFQRCKKYSPMEYIDLLTNSSSLPFLIFNPSWKAPNGWIKHPSADDKPLLSWQSPSLNLITYNFFCYRATKMGENFRAVINENQYKMTFYGFNAWEKQLELVFILVNFSFINLKNKSWWVNINCCHFIFIESIWTTEN